MIKWKRSIKKISPVLVPFITLNCQKLFIKGDHSQKFIMFTVEIESICISYIKYVMGTNKKICHLGQKKKCQPVN